jgi:hypothetical protein
MSLQMTTNLPLTTIKQGTEVVNLILATGLMHLFHSTMTNGLVKMSIT